MAMAAMNRKFGSLFSLPAISVVGAILHNIGQLLVASFIIKNVKLFYYLPALMISAVITGLFIGFAVQFMLKPVKHIFGMGSEADVE